MKLMTHHPLERPMLIGSGTVLACVLGMQVVDYVSPAQTYERTYGKDGHCLQGSSFTLDSRAKEDLIQPDPYIDDPQILRISPHNVHEGEPTYLEFEVRHVPNTIVPALTPRGVATLSFLALRNC